MPQDTTNTLTELSITEVADATEVFKRVHSLIYAKLCARLLRSMKEKQSLPNTENNHDYQRGYGDGRESGLANWPSDLSEFSMAEVVEAVRGPGVKRATTGAKD